MSKPSFNKPSVDMKKFRDFKVRISQVPPMDVAFQSMALTEYELLVATIYKLNELISQTNSYTELINDILEWVVNDGLEESVKDMLIEWKNDGTLEDLINETLFNTKLDKVVFEQYKTDTNVLIENLEVNKLDKILFENFMVDYTEVKNDVELLQEEQYSLKNKLTILGGVYND